MRFLILTLIINFWSYSALGAAEGREARHSQPTEVNAELGQFFTCRLCW